MLGRLVVKLMFKACVPLVAVAGVLSYGVYLKGGDPIRMWGHVASGAFGQAGDMFSKAKNDAMGLAGNIASDSPAQGLLTPSAKTQVFTWKDEDGVTHFGTQAPEGVIATTKTIDPNTNVLAPVQAPEPVVAESIESESVGLRHVAADGTPVPQARGRGNRSSGPSQAVQQLESEMGEPLPGVAGQLLSNGAAGSGGMDPAQLIKMLQAAGN